MEKTAVVTGASRGIGKAIAEEFASLGYNVVLIARHYNELEKVSREFDKKYKTKNLLFECDISSKNKVEKTFSEVIEKLGRIDVLVNNAGINSRKIPSGASKGIPP